MPDKLLSLVAELPPEMQREVQDFVEFLHTKYIKRAAKPFRFDWEGALAPLRGEYTSVQLQHETLNLWGD